METKFLDNESVAKMIIKKGNEGKLSPVEKDLLGDKEFVFHAMIEDPGVLYFASDEIRNDKKFVMAAIKKNSRALAYASIKLRRNKDFVKRAVDVNYRAAEYMSKTLSNDKEFIKELIAEDVDYAPRILKKIKGDFHNDKDFLIFLAEKCPSYDVLKYASEEVKTDKDFILCIIKKRVNDEDCDFNDIENYVPKDLKMDPEFILKLAKVAGANIAENFASEELIKDTNYMVAAIENGMYDYEELPEEIQKVKEIAIAAIENSEEHLDLPEEFYKDKEVVRVMVKNGYENYELYVGDDLELLEDVEFIIELDKEFPGAYDIAMGWAACDEKFLLYIINEGYVRYDDKFDDHIFELMDNSKPLALAYMKNGGPELYPQCWSDEVLEDEEIIECLIEHDAIESIDDMPENYFNNKKFLDTLFEEAPESSLACEIEHLSSNKDAKLDVVIRGGRKGDIIFDKYIKNKNKNLDYIIKYIDTGKLSVSLDFNDPEYGEEVLGLFAHVMEERGELKDEIPQEIFQKADRIVEARNFVVQKQNSKKANERQDFGDADK